MSDFIIIFVDIIILLGIASLINLLASKIKVPYTILLVLVGIILSQLTQLQGFHFLSSFNLTPDILFYIFLPILLFESAYNMKHTDVTKDNIPIRWLAIIWLVISALLIWLLGYYALNRLGFNVPFEVVLLFGSIISATDPVAVLALFKEYGAPKRLSLLFEWESLFNDGTGLALFLVVYEIIKSGSFTWALIGKGIVQFLVMILWGILLGMLFGIICAQIIKRIKNNTFVEVTLTVLLAHTTFIAADLIGHFIHIGEFKVIISWVIATTFAALTMGNYWRTKISPKVEEYMETFRSFFWFRANSLVFILIGLIASQIPFSLQERRIPILVLILITAISRAISVYLPISLGNILKIQEYIPRSRQHLLARWSLRWALAFMMVLLIADNFTINAWSFPFTIKEFLITLVICKIIFTIFVKWLTIGPLMKKLGILNSKDLERFQKFETKISICDTILEKINHIQESYELPESNIQFLIGKYTALRNRALERMKHLLSTTQDNQLAKKGITLHALAIESRYLKELFHYNEITEKIYLHGIYVIEQQKERIQMNLNQIPEKKWTHEHYDFMKKLSLIFDSKKTPLDTYLKQRTKHITTQKVLSELKRLNNIDFWYDKTILEDLIELYTTLNSNAHQKLISIVKTNPEYFEQINAQLLEKWLMKTEEENLNSMLEKELISSILYQKYIEYVENNIQLDIRTE